jgi:cytochrome bd-type quinol oxidase subunit 2
MHFSHSPELCRDLPELCLPTPSAMGVILAGACIVLPVIVGYTIFAYRVFWGKSTALKY